MALVTQGINNEISICENIDVNGQVNGDRNIIVLSGNINSSSIRIDINGNNNTIIMEKIFSINKLHIVCGSHVKAHKTNLKIGRNFSVGQNGKFLLYTSGNVLTIGKNCMFSSSITIRCGECPHLVFDLESGEYLDESKGVFIGDHVWVGENAYFTKAASVGDECIVGACSVVTRRFAAKNVAIAGNPAKVVREGIHWIRNPVLLEDGSKYKAAYEAYHSHFSA